MELQVGRPVILRCKTYIFLTYVILSTLNSFILLRNICEKVNLKSRHFLLGGHTNIIFNLVLDI